MKINKESARRILADVASAAASDSGSPEWIRRIRELEEACGEKNATFFAALGTAMLAKCVEPTVDVFALKANASKRAYSARSLCKDVLAADATKHRIDLGVSGREPLNNQPFFTPARMTDLNVQPQSEPAKAKLLECLHALEVEPNPQSALRAFVAVRKRELTSWRITGFDPEGMTAARLAGRIDSFVRQNSEKGKRAQAAAAGLLDAAYGQAVVETTRVNDPDAHVPGDVVTRDATGDPLVAYEVRDKPISAADLRHFARKLANAGVRSGAVVAAAGLPDEQELEDAVRWGESLGLSLIVFDGWTAFVRTLVYAGAAVDPAAFFAAAGVALTVRAEELEVSAAGRKTLAELLTAPADSVGP